MFTLSKGIFRKLIVYSHLLKYFKGNIRIIRKSALCNNLTTHTKHNFYSNVQQPVYKTLLCSSLLTWFGFYKEEEEKESELITTLKRSILSMQRKEYVKAEQMLHIALRLAQEQQNIDGITYAYDLMANLALERSQYDKAEKLFVNVLQRLLSTGTPEDDIKVVHISLKLARICHKKKEYEKADIGFKWCLETIKKHIDSNDGVILSGIISDWYANFLLEQGNNMECLKHLEEAYKIYSKMEGLNSEKSVLLLNDLGSVNWQDGNYQLANEYLSQALILGKQIEDFDHLGIIYANLGLVKFKLGILAEAEKYCKEGWKIGKKQNSMETINQANYCFEQLRTLNK